ncbi:hypothetical protein GGI09_002485 [Coemansia sp. S100]|nr:hypothetical protein GGI09_002485 [Coemansia sp. S100]KAJ2108069.1 hypothetical protein GGI16_001278 [Coemansia sp. S142-1]
MANVDELQKRVDTLQKQLRKAGDHLKRLAAENGALGEQIEKLNEREVQLQTQIQETTGTVTGYQEEIAQLKVDNQRLGEKEKDGGDKDSQSKVQQLEKRIAELVAQNEATKVADAWIGEWEAAAKEWATDLGLADGSDAAAVIQSVKSRLLQAPVASDTANGDLSLELTQLRSELDAERKSRQALEQSNEELGLKLKAFTDGEAAVSALLSSGLNTADNIPDVVPTSLRAELELVAGQLKQLQATSQEERSQHATRVSALEAQVSEVHMKLNESTSAREELAQDYDHLLQRIGTMKDALTAKMSGESEELKRLRREVAGAKSATSLAEKAVAQSEDTVRGLEKTMRAMRKEMDETKHALWESQETASRVQGEYAAEADDAARQISALQAKLLAAEAQLEADGMQRDQLEDRVEQLQSDLNQALNSEGQWVGEREVHLVTIQNLQGALERLQESKDAEIDMAVEKLRDELRTATKDLRAALARAERAEGQLRKSELSGATAEQYQQRLAEQVGELERLRHEVAVLKDHLNESMRRLREESSEFNLDKRVITNLIVGFLALPYGDSKRFEILQLMSSILQFSEEQQEKAGLIRKAKRPPLSVPGTPTVPDLAELQLETKDSFGDQWISFLLRESSTTRNKRP